MSEAADTIMSAIHSAFDSYQRRRSGLEKPQLDHAGGMPAFDQGDTARIGSSGLPDREEARLMLLPQSSRPPINRYGPAQNVRDW